MAVEADIVAYLNGQAGLVSATNLFEGLLPEDPAACVAVAPTGGELSDDYVSGASLDAPTMEYSRFQVMVRDATMAAARTTAHAVYALLANLGPTTLSTRTYNHVESIDGEPSLIGQDQQARWEYVMNFRAMKARG